jgi:Carbohydrate family 9 binding domain-like
MGSVEPGPDDVAGGPEHHRGPVPGPAPRFPGMPRWVLAPGVPDSALPPVPAYDCRRVPAPPVIDGTVEGGAWDRVAWSAPFVEIESGRAEGPATRVALLWDAEHLYAGFRVEDPDVRGTVTGHHEQVYVTDDDVELFVEGADGYYEIGVNPLNTVYEFRWTWVEPIVERRDFAAIDRLLRVPDFLYYAPRPGERLGRVGEMDWDLPGLRQAVRIQGTLNFPDDVDQGWTVTIAIPWQGLRATSPGGGRYPPAHGDVLRIQAYRAHHDRRALPRRADQPSQVPVVHQSWSVMGNGTLHNPERWVTVRFVDEPV